MPVRLIKTPRFGGERGWFSETYNARRFAADGIAADFVQDNHSYSREAGTVRGLHFQLPPSAQDKLVRVTRGRILDVAVDIRRGSPTYGRFVAVELSDGSVTATRRGSHIALFGPAQAATVAVCHARVASARNSRSVRRETRWR
jgi:dTDP-4-dehydrorhamnose 3,5-epimerase